MVDIVKPPLLDEIIIAQKGKDCKEKEKSHLKAESNHFIIVCKIKKSRGLLPPRSSRGPPPSLPEGG
jgi:hypothetical protein